MFSVAIDGPAGAGKSTISRRVAADLSLVYVDTGAMYRAIGWYVIHRGFDPADRAAVLACLPEIQLCLSYSPEQGQRISVNDIDVSEAIRQPEISLAASAVSPLPEVRAFLLEQQRSLAKAQEVIMDGRDIGTVILPDASLKVFLTASPEERARRRCAEYEAKGLSVSYETILDEVRTRDHQDMTRETSPLCMADDAVLLDTTSMTFEQVVEQLKSMIKERKHHVL